MTKQNVIIAVNDAKRFIEQAEKAKVDLHDSWTPGTASTGALRRASMDLTRSLAAMRKA